MENLGEKYDVIVVGAGPAGGSCARELAKMGHKVLIIDRSAEIGEPNYSTAGTPPETIKEFNLPQSVIFTGWNTIELRGPTTSRKWQYGKTIGYSLKFRELKQFLTKDDVEKGADVLLSTIVEDLLVKDGKIIGVKTSNPKSKEILAQMVVDATGVDGILITKLGLRNNNKLRVGIGYEQLMSNVKINPRCATFGFSTKYAPGGYWWILPTGSDTAKVGLGILPSVLKRNRAKIPNLQELFTKLTQLPFLKEAEEIETHSHPVIVDVGGIKRYSSDGFIGIGDAAAQINPLIGEGIRHCLRSGKIAANVISSAIKKGDFSQKELANYDKTWKAYIGGKWRFGLWFETILYKMDDKYLDKIVTILGNFSPAEAINFLWFYDIAGVKRALIEKVKGKFGL